MCFLFVNINPDDAHFLWLLLQAIKTFSNAVRRWSLFETDSHVSSGLSPGKWPDNRKSMSLLNGKHKSRIHEWVISGGVSMII